MDFVTVKKVPFRRTVDGTLVVITFDELVEQIESKLDPIKDKVKIDSLKKFKSGE